MHKTILITGSTDGIGLETAKRLVPEGHTVLLHGRSTAKLEAAKALLAPAGDVETFRADLSRLREAAELADAVAAKHPKLDVLINNAGVLKLPDPATEDGLDARFAVNTVAPYLLAKRLLPAMAADGRIVNLSSAAQAPVDIAAMTGPPGLADMEAYAQSKLAITMWSRVTGLSDDWPMVVAVNPGSLLASKMVKEGFGIAGKDIGVGADILVRAALSDEFAEASGQYFDNDAGDFGPPHPDALVPAKSEAVVEAVEAILHKMGLPPD